jgi:hypothetical protein
MRDYVRTDGFPIEGWLRTHLRVGGKFIKVARFSMTIVGRLADWSLWTGMPFDRSGELLVAGTLSPVMVSLELTQFECRALTVLSCKIVWPI